MAWCTLAPLREQVPVPSLKTFVLSNGIFKGALCMVICAILYRMRSFVIVLAMFAITASAITVDSMTTRCVYTWAFDMRSLHFDTSSVGVKKTSTFVFTLRESCVSTGTQYAVKARIGQHWIRIFYILHSSFMFFTRWNRIPS